MTGTADGRITIRTTADLVSSAALSNKVNVTYSSNSVTDETFQQLEMRGKAQRVVRPACKNHGYWTKVHRMFTIRRLIGDVKLNVAMLPSVV